MIPVGLQILGVGLFVVDCWYSERTIVKYIAFIVDSYMVINKCLRLQPRLYLFGKYLQKLAYLYHTLDAPIVHVWVRLACAVYLYKMN